MILKSPAKINLYLHVLDKLSNGYHVIDSLFVRINLFDEVTISKTSGASIERHGDLSHLGDSDLCYKAALMLKKKSGYKYGCSISLKKKVPIGAGLGGGSSNAATVLIGLNKIWELGYKKDELKSMATQIGADVPFFIEEANCFATGIGDSLTVLENDELLPKYFVTITPDIQISTDFIYKNFKLGKKHLEKPPIRYTEKNKFLRTQKNYFTFGRNDLEATVINLFPKIAKYMAKIKFIASKLNIPVESCRISGSGATIFCGFATKEIALDFQSLLSEHLKRSEKEKEPVILISRLLS